MNSSNADDDTDRDAVVVLEYLLLADLRKLLAEPTTDGTRAALLSLLDAFLDGSGRGSNSAAELGCPSRPVASLRLEDLADDMHLTDLRERLFRDVPFEEAAAALLRDLDVWMDALAARRRQRV